MAEGTIIFTITLFMFFISAFITDKIQPNLSFIFRAFLVAGGGFMFILISSSLILPGEENLSIRNPILIIYTPTAYITWILLRITNKKRQ